LPYIHGQQLGLPAEHSLEMERVPSDMPMANSACARSL
jgi:hypothetical protein